MNSIWLFVSMLFLLARCSLGYEGMHKRNVMQSRRKRVDEAGGQASFARRTLTLSRPVAALLLNEAPYVPVLVASVLSACISLYLDNVGVYLVATGSMRNTISDLPVAPQAAELIREAAGLLHESAIAEAGDSRGCGSRLAVKKGSRRFSRPFKASPKTMGSRLWSGSVISRSAAQNQFQLHLQAEDFPVNILTSRHILLSSQSEFSSRCRSCVRVKQVLVFVAAVVAFGVAAAVLRASTKTQSDDRKRKDKFVCGSQLAAHALFVIAIARFLRTITYSVTILPALDAHTSNACFLNRYDNTYSWPYEHLLTAVTTLRSSGAATT